MDALSPYFSVDNILKAIAIVGSIVSFVVYIRTELSQLRADVTLIKDHQTTLMDSIKALNTILTQIAVQDVRLNMIEKDIDELRHGKGMVV